MIDDSLTIEDLRDDFLSCRSIGHAWDDNPAGEVDSDLWRASSGVLALRCARCHTERFDYLGRDLTVFQRYYRYPSHYTTIKGLGRSTVPFRGELLRRSLLIRVYQGNGGRKR